MYARPREQRKAIWARSTALLAAGLLAAPTVFPPSVAAAAEARQLLIRCDDVGMCHAVNTAVRRLLATGVPISASVMFPCPWYLEAVDVLKQHPEVAVGVHLTLNSEWEQYKWGPVAGRSAVPSLVDMNGHFLPSEEAFTARSPDLREVEAELRAQVERALASGLRIDYLDAHMLTAYSKAELRALVERLARDYKLGISTYFGERSASLWDVPPERKLSAAVQVIREDPGDLTLLVVHLGLDNDEMAALVDTNNPADPFRVGRHRQAELDAVGSPAFRAAVAAAELELVTYRQVIARRGLGTMAPPAQASGYAISLASPK